ncbi:MAG: winged helix-turn-helix domain-containing protein [Burkholderiales bacterium]|nr:winged helix-turn-helix domain-containing protein [Burkholderiales bacterium]
MHSGAWTFDGGRARIDVASRLLLLDGQPARLGGRAFDVLDALVERRERIVTKGELLDLVWPGLVVEENNLQVQVMTLRRLLGNAAIATVSGRGYRWTLPAHDDGAAPKLPTATAGNALLGRAELLAQAAAVLDAGQRLLTLTGPGGSGKTRVAQRLAALRGERQACWLVMLAPARDIAQFWAALATALGVQEAGATSLPDLVRAWLAPRAALLVLDNLEHLPEASAAVAGLRDACPQLQLLATSRSLLHVADEQVLRVPPLAAADAAELFTRRAAEVGRPLDSAPDRAAVPSICARLDGLPLAIELAASRLRVLSPAALAERLLQRLPLLKGGPTDAPKRQQTLRDTIAWSHDLLPAPAQALYRRLGVFVGGWSLDAAEAVDDEPASTLDGLETLLEHNLVQRLDDVEGAPRYAMLETIREFALEQLEASGEAAARRDRHAAHCLRLARTAEPQITGAGRGPWLNRLRADLSNLRAALAWTVRERHDPALGLPLAAAMAWPWYFFGLYQEGRRWLAEALALDGAHPRDTAAALSGAARLATYGGDLASAETLAADSVARWRALDEPRGLAFALFNQAIPFAMRGDFANCRRILDEARALFERLADPWGIAVTIAYIGASLGMLPGSENVEAGRLMLAEGRARFRALDDDWGATFCAYYLGLQAMRGGRFDEAWALTAETLTYSRSIGDHYRIARNLHQLAEIDLLRGRLADALPLLAESVALNFEHGRPGDIALQMRLLAGAAEGAGRGDLAVRCAAYADANAQAVTTMPPDDRAPHLQRVERLRARLDAERWATAWAAGATMNAAAAAALIGELGAASGR